MPDMDGITLMERVHVVRPGLPVVLVTAHATVETAVQALRNGATHYLTKPIRYDELALVLRHAVAHERARRDVVRLRGELERAAGFEEIVGTSPAMRQVFSMVEQVAGADATILLRGETGTGKELIARAIHRRSPRADRTFVAVNCSAVPHELMESEFFGHEKGAFTGAAARRIGRFEQADGSTLFLDEVGDLDLSVQTKLLRVLQEQEIVRVGGDRPIKVAVRIVAATNRDLEALVKEGRFRDDLYYRLNVIPIRLPSLRERAGDLPALMEHFLGSFARRYGRDAPLAPPDLLAAAMAYPWPGNVRELRNVCERAVLMGWAAVAPILGTPAEEEAASASLPEFSLPLLEARQRLVERFERDYLTRLLREHKGRIGEVARAAGIAERNLYEKMKAYGLSRDDYR
jgi:two-component system, NtrC family, response regulator AtoC